MNEKNEYVTVNELIEKLKTINDGELWIYYQNDEVMHEGKKTPVYGFLDIEKMTFAKMKIKCDMPGEKL